MKKFISNVILLVCLVVGVGKVWGQTGAVLPYTLNALDLNNSNIIYNTSGSLSVVASNTKIQLNNASWNVTRYFDMALANIGGEIAVDFELWTLSAPSKTTAIYASKNKDLSSPRTIDTRSGGIGNHTLQGKIAKDEKYIRIYFQNPSGSSTGCNVTGVRITKSLSVSPTSITTFSDAAGKFTEQIAISYSNIGGNLSLSSDSPDFTVNPTSISLAEGSSGTVNATVTFSPTSLGAKTGNIIITDNSYTDNKAKVSVSGTASIPVITNFAAGAATYTSIPLSWDNITGVDGYYLTVINDNTSATVINNQNIGVVNSYTLNNLIPHTPYTIKLQAKYGSQTSSPAIAQKSTLNMTPQNIQTSAVTEQSFTASWNAVADVDGYEIKVYKSSDNSVVKTDRTTALSYTFNGLTRGTNYYYTVSAYVGSTVSQPSNNINVMTAVFLPLSITQTTGINYEWLTNSNTKTTWTTAEESGYELQQSSASVVVKFNDIPLSANIKLYRTRNSQTCYSAFPNMYIETSTDGSTWTVIKDLPQDNPTGSASRVNEYTDLSLSADVRQLRIHREAATGSCAGIGLTDGWAFLRELIINPVTITALPATDIEGESFTANWNLVTGATDYAVSVYQKNGSNIIPVATLSRTVNSVSVSGLTPYQTYYYQVRAVFPSGQTQPSNEIKVITLAVPTVGEATDISQTTFTANWSEVSGVDGYYVTVYNADHTIAVGRQQVLGAATTSTNIANLFTGNTYYYTVECYVTLSATEDVTSLPVSSNEFTTTVSEENSGLPLPYITPENITFANNKEVIYEFSGVAGQFIFSTTKGGAIYNSLNPNLFRVYESADKTTWTLLKTFGHGQFDNTNEVIDLSKTTRYIKLAFTKTGSCYATITLSSGAKITKALTVRPTVLTGFSDANQMLTQDFTIHYSNIKTPLTVIPSAHFSVSPSTITPDASGTGSTTVTVTFNPNAITTYNEQIKVEDSDYTTNFVTVNVSGQSRVQSVTGFKYTAVNLTSISLAWDDVAADSYTVTVMRTETSEEVRVVNISGTETSGLIDGLLSNTSYTVSIVAKFGVKTSAPVTITVSTKAATDVPQPVVMDTPPTVENILRHKMTLSEVILSGGVATDGYGNAVEGSFMFTEPEMVVSQGEGQSLTIMFTPVSTDYLPTEFTITVDVAKALQRIEWTQQEQLLELAVDAIIPLTATATSGLSVTYLSSDTDVAEVSDNYLVAKAAGSITLTAVQPGNADFEAAESIECRIFVESTGSGNEEGDDDNPTSVLKPLNINVYPNPTNSTLFVSGIDIQSVELLTVQGQRLLERTFAQPVAEVTLDVAAIPSGLYFVKIVSSSQTVVRPVTIMK